MTTKQPLDVTNGDEVLIIDGAHEYQNGKVMRIDTKTFTLPFCEVHLRNRSGTFMKKMIALVPMKYCAVFNVQELDSRELDKAATRYGADSKAYARIVKAIEKAKGIEEPVLA